MSDLGQSAHTALKKKKKIGGYKFVSLSSHSQRGGEMDRDRQAKVEKKKKRTLEGPCYEHLTKEKYYCMYNRKLLMNTV